MDSASQHLAARAHWFLADFYETVGGVSSLALRHGVLSVQALGCPIATDNLCC